MDVYAELGIKPIINAAGPQTRRGGSLMPPEVIEAMAAASRSFVDVKELHLAAGKRIAELAGVEAAHVCSGAAAGIALMAAACMTGTDPDKIAQLPDTAGMKHKFVVQRAHRNPFDQALRLAGGRFVTIEASVDQLGSAIGNESAALYHTVGRFRLGEALPLAQAAETARRAGVPVIVDAAAQVPPVENLSRFLKEGANLVTFSGGKAIRGPQSTGLILGCADLIEACRLNDNPNMAIGRPMKASKEDIVGLVKAVELYVAKDHAAEMATWEQRVAHIIEALSDLEHVRVERKVPYGIAQQVPMAAVSWDEQGLGIGYEELVQQLLQGRPRIAVRVRQVTPDKSLDGFSTREVRIYPDNLQEGEVVMVARRLREVLAGR